MLMLRRCISRSPGLFKRPLVVLSATAMSTMPMQGAQTTFEGSGDPLTSRILLEHKKLESLFQEYEQLPPDTSSEAKLKLGWEMIRRISMHAATEEMVLYPSVAKHMGCAAGDRLLEETQAVKEVLTDLNAIKDAHDPRAAELVDKTVQMTREHIKDEEQNFLPNLSQASSRAELERLARQFVAARGAAPTRPHPYAPNKPPLNLATNAAAVPLDMVRDAMRFGVNNLATDVV